MDQIFNRSGMTVRSTLLGFMVVLLNFLNAMATWQMPLLLLLLSIAFAEYQLVRAEVSDAIPLGDIFLTVLPFDGTLNSTTTLCVANEIGTGQCHSLEDALKAAKERMLENTQTRKRVWIRLQARKQYNCSVLLSRERKYSTGSKAPCGLSYVGTSGMLASTIIELDASSDCSHAVPKAVQAGVHPEALVCLERAEQVTFSNVAFDTSSITHFSRLVNVAESAMILFYKCLFYVPYGSKPASSCDQCGGAIVHRSQAVIFSCCRFESKINNFTATRITMTYQRPHRDFTQDGTRPGLMISDHNTTTPKSLLRKQEDSYLILKWLEDLISFQRFSELNYILKTYNNSMYDTSKPTLTAHVDNCSFSGVGTCYNRQINDFRMLPSNQTLGYIFHVNLSSNSLVFISHSAFANNHAPLGSIVKVQLNRQTEKAVDQCVHFHGNTFTNNIALIGGSVLIDAGVQQGDAKDTSYVTFSDCQFAGNMAHFSGGAAYLDFGQSSQVGVYFKNCSFERNQVEIRRGGAVYVQGETLSKSRRPTNVYFANCTFYRNGPQAVYTDSVNMAFDVHNTFIGNNDSAIKARSSWLTFSGIVEFRNNTGERGGAMKSTSSILDLRKVERLVMSGNLASEQGHVFYHNLGQKYTWNKITGRLYYQNHEDKPKRCEFLLPDYLRNVPLKDVFAEAMDGSSSDLATRTMPVYMSSIRACYREQFRAMVEAEAQEQEFCMPYAPGGWELRSDIKATSHQECSKDICSTLELYHSNGSCQERCQTTGIRPSAAPLKYITNEAGADECKVPLTNDPLIYRTHRLATSIVYDGFSSCNACIAHLCDKTNRTLSMPRLSAEYCNRPNAYLRTEAALCYSRQQQLLVRQPKTTGQPFPLGTLPVWLFFQSASTSCYKVINEKVLYFNGNCSRELIVEEVQKSNESVKTDCNLFTLAKLHRHIYHSTSVPLLPGYSRVLTPWSSVLHNWQSESWTQPGNPSICLDDGSGRFPNMTHSISNLTLNPAPGEEFSLDFRPADELLNDAMEAVLEVKLEADQSNVLLGTGPKFHPDLSVVFKASRGGVPIALYGPPGATGNLRISMLEYHLTRITEGKGGSLDLKVPFRLRQCHMGFDLFSDDMATQLATQFHSVLGQVNEQRKEDIKAMLSCHPRKSTCVKASRAGKHVRVGAACWAGHYNTTSNPGIAELCMAGKVDTIPYSQFRDNFGQDLCGGVERRLGFDAVLCQAQRCACHNDTWEYERELGPDKACAGSCTGPLCTSCEKGFKKMFFRQYCEDCNGKRSVSLSAFFFIIFLATLIPFSILMFTNFGVSATFDSWLFFTKGSLAVFGDSLFGGHDLTAMIFSLGLGGILCTDEDIPPMLLASENLIFSFLLFLPVVIVMLLAKYSIRVSELLQRFQRRRSIRHVFWLMIIISISLHIETISRILKHTKLGGRMVPYADGSIEYFSDGHIGYALAAIAMTCVCVLAPFLLLAWRPTHRWPGLIGFIDEATFIYRPQMWWWCCVNILRRVVLVGIDVCIQSVVYKYFSLMLVTNLLVFLQAFFRPLKPRRRWMISDFDNRLETLLLLILSLFCGQRLCTEEEPSSLEMFILPFYIVVTVLCGILHFSDFIQSWCDTLNSRPRLPLRELWRRSTLKQAKRASGRHGPARETVPTQQGLTAIQENGRLMECASSHGESTSCRTTLRESMLMEPLIHAVKNDLESC